MSEVAERLEGSASVVGGSAEMVSGSAATSPATAEERRGEILRVAMARYEEHPDWVSFFREILGVDGLAYRLFPESDEMRSFEGTPEYREIQQMVCKLRESPPAEAEGREPIRVITVRLPKCVHEMIKREAENRSTSINQLCISKLLQALEEEQPRGA